MCIKMANQQVGSNAQVKPPSAVATAVVTQAPKSADAIAAAPTRGVASTGKNITANKNYNGGKNANASNQSASTNATAKATKPNADMNAAFVDVEPRHSADAPLGLYSRQNHLALL
ncbi:hypothetical protein PR003_g9892 [Phytophthora rubi]|uniref:Uncharacterized protein n=1 Tax=Phytophthora rubi TaxID=129364 RepID=A0A6A4FQX4_9STRA|nr:hypothetical protein PR003_g9892 [Phytophthora rubi]